MKKQFIKEIFPLNYRTSPYALIAVPCRLAVENKNWDLASQIQLPKTIILGSPGTPTDHQNVPSENFPTKSVDPLGVWDLL